MSRQFNSAHPLMKWDLSDLYTGVKDIKVTNDKKDIGKLILMFSKTYKGKINSELDDYGGQKGLEKHNQEIHLSILFKLNFDPAFHWLNGF